MKRLLFIMAACSLVLAFALSPTTTAQAQKGKWLWLVEYFPNKGLQGAPVITTTATNVVLVQTLTLPAALQADNYSARFSTAGDFQAGVYHFTLVGNDGIRLYIDNILVIDQWVEKPLRGYTVDIAMLGGTHSLRVEYFDSINVTALELDFAKVRPYTSAPVITDGAKITVLPPVTEIFVAPPNSKIPLPGFHIKGMVVGHLRLRLGPGEQYGYIYTLEWGTPVSIIGRSADGTWLKVSVGNQLGWITTFYTRITTGSFEAIPIIAP